MASLARHSIALVLVLVIQTTWVADFRPFGVAGDLFLCLTIAAAMVRGPHYGAAVGFAAGIAVDLVVLNPFGLSSLTYLIVGHAVGLANQGVLRSAAWIPATVTIVGSVGGVVLYVVLGRLLGQPYGESQLPVIVLWIASLNVALVVPAMRLVRWMAGRDTAPMVGAWR